MHAAAQDLEVFSRVCGSVPQRLFDTQIAAGFLGLSTPSLAVLHQQYLGVDLPKGDRMTNWLSRPLTERQKSYAASDVKELIKIYNFQIDRLNELEPHVTGVKAIWSPNTGIIDFKEVTNKYCLIIRVIKK